MEEAEKVFVNSVSVKLEKVEYEFKNDIEEGLEIHAVDALQLVSCDTKHFIVRITRSLIFEPKEYYYLSVSSLIDFRIDEKTLTFFKNKEEIELYVSNKLSVFVEKTPILTSVSLLISQITSTFGRFPVITPPNVIKSETK